MSFFVGSFINPWKHNTSRTASAVLKRSRSDP